MKNVQRGLSDRYRAALRLQLTRKSPDDGDQAHGLGRAALAGGMASRDLALLHERAVNELTIVPVLASQRRDFRRRARRFLAQVLVPLEAAQLATRNANRKLRQRNETLRLHTAELARGYRRLEREVARRKRATEAVQRGKVLYQELFKRSESLQRELRQLTRQILLAQEEERKRISRELHDEVVQMLVGINVHLSALGQGATVTLGSLKSKIVRTQRLVEKSVKAVHRFARELRPAVLDDLGLIPALQAFSESLATRHQFRIRLTAFGGVESLAGSKRTVLFRVAQEALNNVARHAGATQVRVTISEIPGAIRMEIADNGKSFAVDQTLGAGGRRRLGLVGMKERMEMVGGSLDINSVAGRGTTVLAELPFEPGKTLS